MPPPILQMGPEALFSRCPSVCACVRTCSGEGILRPVCRRFLVYPSFSYLHFACSQFFLHFQSWSEIATGKKSEFIHKEIIHVVKQNLYYFTFYINSDCLQIWSYINNGGKLLIAAVVFRYLWLNYIVKRRVKRKACLVLIDMNNAQVRVKQQVLRVDVDWRLATTFTAQTPLGVHKTPEIRSYTKHSKLYSQHETGQSYNAIDTVIYSLQNNIWLG